MLRRSFSHRVLSALSGVGLALFSLLPPAAVPCPMHAAGASSSHAPGAAWSVASPEGDATLTSSHLAGHAPVHAGAHASGHEPAHTAAHMPGQEPAHAAAHMPGHGPAHTAPDAPVPPHPCDCTTNCCGVASVALLEVPATLTAVLLVPHELVAVDGALLRRKTHARLLPFANGPPELIAG